MDGNKQLLTEDSGCGGIDAPNLIREKITADEKDTTQTKDAPVKEEVNATEHSDEVLNEITVELVVKDEDLETTLKKDENKPASPDNKETDNLPDDKTTVKNENQNVQTSPELNEQPRNKQDTEKGKENDNSRSNGNHFVEVRLIEGNNNVTVDDTKGSRKDSVRRTRFSSEITIQPKAYFQAGSDTIVMMPPNAGTESDDVFKDEPTDPQSPHVVLEAKPSNAVLPRTFLPLTIFSCLFCCPMIGIFAIYKSYSVKQFIKEGELRKANETSQHARQLGVLTLFIGFFFVLAVVIIAVLVSVLT